MRIRIMDIRDYDEVYRLWSSTQGMGLRSLDDSREGIGKFLNTNPNTSFVAVTEDKIVGVILCGHDGRRGYIYHTAVDEAYRRQGIGRLLVKTASDELKKEGIHKAALIVFQNNRNGNEFWESQGFTGRKDLVYRNKSLNDSNY